MADYYPLLAKALAGLPSSTTQTARRAIYDRARKALIGQLRSLNPPLAEDVIAREEAALDAAVARLEEERAAAPQASAPPGPTAATRPSSPPSPQRPLATPVSPAGARPPTMAPAGAPLPARAPAAPNPGGAAAVRPSVASASPARYAPPPRPSMAPTSQTAAAAASQPTKSAGPSPVAAGAPSLEPAPGGSPAARPSFPPPLGAPRVLETFEEGQAPLVATAPAEGLAAPPIRANGEPGRPIAPGAAPRRGRNPWPWVALMLVIAVVAVSAGFAVLRKEKPQDLVIKGEAEAPAKSEAAQNKIAERVSGGAAPPTAPASPPPSPSAAPASPTAPASPAATAASPTAPPASPTAPSAPTAPAGETPIPTVTVPIVPVKPSETAQGAAQPASIAPGLARAALLLETPNDPQKPKVDIGTAVWSLVPAAAGPAQAAGPTVQAEVDVPDMKMHATLTIRKNIDPSLPATHTMDLRFTFADGAEAKGFKDMALPQLRRDDATTGDAVSGVRVKINDDYFLIGLTRSDVDAAHNLDLLNSRNWIDFPLLLNDDHVAKLTFEKGATGQSVIGQAIEAWK